MTEIEILERNDSTLLKGDVDFSQRIIDVIAVPWDQEATVIWRGSPWREVFERGAFDGIEDHSGRVPVNREHKHGDTIGKVVKLDPYDDRGLIASIKVAKTPRGDETLELASEDMLGASAGYFVKKPSDAETNTRSMLRRVKKAFLHHLSMVEVPAYAGAMPVAVREGLSAERAAGEPLNTPALDSYLSSETRAWALSRSSKQ